MMREIKFRVWSNKLKKYYNMEDNIFVLGQLVKGKLIFSTEQEIIEQTYEQYTGLKDKNGVEIYEGDVVIDRNKSSLLLDKKYTVIFDEFSCAFMIEDKYGCNMLSVKKTLEVIGNIHDMEDQK